MLQIVVAAVGIALISAAGLVGWRMEHARQTRLWLQGLHAKYFWDHEAQSPDEAIWRSGQATLAGLIGPELVSKMVAAEIVSPNATDEHLRRIDTLSHVETLVLHSEAAGQLTLERVAKLKQLRRLKLTGGNFDFVSLLELRKAPMLRTLELRQMRLTKAEVAVLASALPNVDLNYNLDQRESAYERSVASRFRSSQAPLAYDLRFEALPAEKKHANM